MRRGTVGTAFQPAPSSMVGANLARQDTCVNTRKCADTERGEQRPSTGITWGAYASKTGETRSGVRALAIVVILVILVGADECVGVA